MAAAMLSVECQKRNIRSVKFITVHEAVDTTSGSANTGSGMQTQHTYNTAGVYSVTLTAARSLHSSVTPSESATDPSDIIAWI